MPIKYANLMLLLLYMFKILKKMDIFCIFWCFPWFSDVTEKLFSSRCQCLLHWLKLTRTWDNVNAYKNPQTKEYARVIQRVCAYPLTQRNISSWHSNEPYLKQLPQLGLSWPLFKKDRCSNHDAFFSMRYFVGIRTSWPWYFWIPGHNC